MALQLTPKGSSGRPNGMAVALCDTTPKAKWSAESNFLLSRYPPLHSAART